jgi:hypothetical protein
MWTKFCDMENILQKNVYVSEVMKVSKNKHHFLQDWFT